MRIEKPEKKIPYATRLKPSTIEKLKAKAKADKASAALVIETLIDRYLK